HVQAGETEQFCRRSVRTPPNNPEPLEGNRRHFGHPPEIGWFSVVFEPHSASMLAGTGRCNSGNAKCKQM
ncbi:hypothetical protein AVEN_260017-1, partial [Araneus ventricosus]